MAADIDGSARAESSAAPAHRWNVAPLLTAHLYALIGLTLPRNMNASPEDWQRFRDTLNEAKEVLRGLEAYQTAPLRTPPTSPKTLWQDGAARLYDFGGEGTDAILIVPSLINGPEILDLLAENSRVRWLREQGWRVFMIDWGFMGTSERKFGVSEYVTERLIPAFKSAAALHDGPIHVAGHCMGGMLALALAAQRPKGMGRMALLGTPWDFTAFPGLSQASKPQEAEDLLRTYDGFFGAVPPNIIQQIFTVRQLDSTLKRFQQLPKLDPNDLSARTFIAVEDWLNEGRPLPIPAAREALIDWFRENLPIKEKWQVAGEHIVPRNVDTETLVVIGSRDGVVPSSSALPLANALPNGQAMEVEAGHLGIVLGERATRSVWEPLLSFLKSGNEPQS